MARGAMEYALSATDLDRVFAEEADRQYTRSLLFSALTDLMSPVVCRIRRSVRLGEDARRDGPRAGPVPAREAGLVHDRRRPGHGVGGGPAAAPARPAAHPTRPPRPVSEWGSVFQGRADDSGAARPAHPLAGNPGRRGTPAQPRRVTVRKSRKEQAVVSKRKVPGSRLQQPKAPVRPLRASFPPRAAGARRDGPQPRCQMRISPLPGTAESPAKRR